MNIPFLFGQLFKLEMSFIGQLNAAFFCFIEKHPSVERLQLEIDSLCVEDLSKMAKSLPSLTSIKFIKCKISTDDAINCISKVKNLKKFAFN